MTADGGWMYSDYVFFFAYLQLPPEPGQALWSNAEEMCEVNGVLAQPPTDDRAESDAN